LDSDVSSHAAVLKEEKKEGKKEGKKGGKKERKKEGKKETRITEYLSWKALISRAMHHRQQKKECQ